MLQNQDGLGYILSLRAAQTPFTLPMLFDLNLNHESLKSLKDIAEQAFQMVCNVRSRGVGRMFIRRDERQKIEGKLRQAENNYLSRKFEKAIKKWTEIIEASEIQLQQIRSKPFGRLVVSSRKLSHIKSLKKKAKKIQTHLTKKKQFQKPNIQRNRSDFPLFDSEWYLEQIPQVALNDLKPIEHYRTVGWKEGRRPHPLFNVRWYLESNPDVAQTGDEPFGHYLTKGWKEGRNPHPFFSSTWYLRRNEDVAKAEEEPLGHYLRTGWREGRKPHPLFYTQKHLQCCEAGIQEDGELLQQYVKKGWESNQEESIPTEIKNFITACSAYPRNSANRISESDFQEIYLDDLDMLFNKKQNIAQNPQKSPARKLHILFIGHEASATGAPIALLELIRELSKSSQVVPWIYLMSGGPLREQYAALAPTILKDELLSPPSDQPALLAQWFTNLPGEKLALCSTTVTREHAFALNAHDIPVIGWIHELTTFNETHIGSATMQALSMACSQVVYAAEWVRQANTNKFHLDATNSNIILYGADHHFGSTHKPVCPDPATWWGKLKIPSEAFVVMASGTADARKGPDLFIQVAARLITLMRREHSTAPPVHFIWIGKCTDPYLLWCKHDINALDLNEQIHFVGHQDDPALFYAKANVFLLTSREEPVGLVALEAMTYEIPVVVFEGATGVVEYCDQGVYAVPYLDVETMARKAVELLMNPQSHRELGKRIALHIKQNIRWEKTTQQFLALIQETVSSKKSKNHLVVIANVQPPIFVGKITDGGGLRTWGLAKSLKAALPEYTVTIAYRECYRDGKADLWCDNVFVTTWAGENDLKSLLAVSSVALASYALGDISVRIAEMMRKDQKLILDCYVPAYIEVSARKSENVQQEYDFFMKDVERWNQVLKRGDIFLCANDAQQKFYTGVLSALGMINPKTYHDNPVMIVPYGIPDDDPQAVSIPCTSLLKNPESWKILWFGAVYPWFDLRSLMDAVALINKLHPCELIVVGLTNPLVNQPDFVSYQQITLEYAQQECFRGLIHLIDWVPYEDRANWYLDADMIVVINHPGAENQYAWRTRLVDYIWTESLLATNGGDSLSDELFAHQAAVRLTSLEPQQLSNDIYQSLKDSVQANILKANLQQIRHKLKWSEVIRPLVQYIHHLS